MSNENEKNINNQEQGEKAPKRKVSVVFRSQNSQTIKELPKNLRNAAAGKNAGGNKNTARTDGARSGANNGPRPLPAGTKPVKPAVYGRNNEAAQGTGAAAGKQAQAADKAVKAVKTVRNESAEKAAEAVKRTAAPAEENAAMSAEKLQPKTETMQAEPEREVKPVENAAESAEKAAAAKAPAEENQSAGGQAQTAAENSQTAAAPAIKNEPAAEAAPAEHTAAEAPKAAAETAPADDMPKIRIVKSYANYDMNAVIKEASRAAEAARQERNRAARQQRGNGQGQQGQRSADGSQRPRYNNGEGGQGGQRFGQRNANGQRPGQGAGQGRPGAGGDQRRGGLGGRTVTMSQRNGEGRPDNRNAAGGRPAPGGARGGAGFDVPSNKNGNTRGKAAGNQYKDKHDKKDKYKDELVMQKNTRNGKGAFIKPEPKKEAPEEDIKVIQLPETLTVKDLADKLKLQPSVIIKKLFLEGKMMTPNTDLSYEEAEEIAMEYDILCEKEAKVDVIAELLKEEEESEDDLVSRSPVVCVMGHVDHGKTSLLDAIRNTNVTSHEAGGITQHIGASVVKINGNTITFLDTPGHEAFTAMRLRGAQSTDIAVLVVAADDGVKPQTIEAISHAKSAGVEVVVAINKIDKPEANIDRVKKELTEYELVAEDWGGSTPMVPVSAKTGEGIEDLLEMILLQADVMELKANPNRKARGIVIEAELDKGRGPVATVLVQKGTLNVGDNVAAGACYGKVRAMIDDKGNRIKKAGPSMPVEILGLNDVPNAGEVFMETDDEKIARNIAETFIAEHKKQMLEETKSKMNLTDLFDEIKAGNVKELPIIIKADVQGSVEAVKQSLGKLSNEEVAVKVIHSGVGNINESDVSLASAGNAIIIGFNVKPDSTAKSVAEQENVEIRLYRVIYQAIEDLEAALTGMLAPVYEEQITGHAIIRQIFKASGVGNIAGCYVTDGIIERGSRARITRNDKQIFDGDIASLKRFKDEVKEVKLGFECGMVFEDFSDVAVDDNIEIYKMVQVKRERKA